MPGLENRSVTSAHMLMARIQSRDYTQLQGVLGDVVQEKKMAGGGPPTQSSPRWVCVCSCPRGQSSEWEGLISVGGDIWMSCSPYF